MKTLITGSSGFLGSTLINDFGESFGDIVAVSRSLQYPQKRNVKSYSLDVTSPDFIDIVQENSPSAIVHTAARSIVRDCEQNPGEAFKQNIMATVNVLESARRLDTDIPVVVLETDKVYGQQPPESIPTSEDDPLLGSTPYEFSKVMTANICNFYRMYYNLKVYSLRPANLYGYWDKNKSRIIPNTFTKLLRNESPIVFTDSMDQLREYIYVNDVCDIIHRLIVQKPAPGAFNVSSGFVYSPFEIINMIIDIVGSNIKPSVVEKPFQFQEIQSQALKGDKLNKTVLGVQYTPIEMALEDMYIRIKTEGYGA